MASTQAAPLGNRQIQQALRRGAKAALVAGGIQPSTRRGNKELTLAVQRLAQQPYSTLKEATQTGETLGQKIVEISQTKGLTHLDGAVVRQMMLIGDIPTVTKASAKPEKTTPVVVAAPQAPEPAPATTAKAKLEEAAVEVVEPAETEAEESVAVEDAIAEEPAETEAEESVAVEDAIAAEAVEAEAEESVEIEDAIAAEAAEAEVEESVEIEDAIAEEPAETEADEAEMDAIAAEPAETETVDPAEPVEPEPEAVGKAQ
ncbi:hypothetical protein C7293_14640 [filamentous cyanobacterium CCT1]|nr:hypothetical protein C7293_14640 [filamentous cyanobacterium CCT1]